MKRVLSLGLVMENQGQKVIDCLPYPLKISNSFHAPMSRVERLNTINIYKLQISQSERRIDCAKTVRIYAKNGKWDRGGCGKQEKMAHSFPHTALSMHTAPRESRKLDLLLPRRGTACLRDPARRVAGPFPGAGNRLTQLQGVFHNKM